MKTWRVLLLMLLAVLLPVRGAMAAAMLCPPGGHGHTLVQAPAAHAMHQSHGQPRGEHSGHAHAHHMAALPDPADPPAGDTHSSTCHACASLCSMTPLLSAIPALPQPSLVLSLSFPPWAAPAPLFLSDGQERPPRSI